MPEIEMIQRVKYKLDELKPKARQSALEKVGESLYEGFESSWLSDDMKMTLSEVYGMEDMKVFFSLNYCQGDGVAFSGQASFADLAKKDAHLKQMEDELDAMLLLRGDDLNYDLYVEIEHRGHYSHWNSMVVQTSHGCYDMPADAELLVIEVASKLESYMDEKVKEISRRLEKEGYEQLEYERSEERCQEHIEANDLRFTEDGEIID